MSMQDTVISKDFKPCSRISSEFSTVWHKITYSLSIEDFQTLIHMMPLVEQRVRCHYDKNMSGCIACEFCDDYANRFVVTILFKLGCLNNIYRHEDEL